MDHVNCEGSIGIDLNGWNWYQMDSKTNKCGIQNRFMTDSIMLTGIWWSRCVWCKSIWFRSWYFKTCKYWENFNPTTLLLSELPWQPNQHSIIILMALIIIQNFPHFTHTKDVVCQHVGFKAIRQNKQTLSDKKRNSSLFYSTRLSTLSLFSEWWQHRIVGYCKTT